MTLPIDYESLKRMIEKRIAKLEEQLEFYRELLRLLEECSAAQGAQLLEEIRDEDGSILAQVYKLSNNALKYVPREPLNPRNPYVRHLLRKLARLGEEGIELTYNVEKDEQGRITSLTVTFNPPTEEVQEHILNLLRFVTERTLSKS